MSAEFRSTEPPPSLQKGRLGGNGVPGGDGVPGRVPPTRRSILKAAVQPGQGGTRSDQSTRSDHSTSRDSTPDRPFSAMAASTPRDQIIRASEVEDALSGVQEGVRGMKVCPGYYQDEHSLDEKTHGISLRSEPLPLRRERSMKRPGSSVSEVSVTFELGKELSEERERRHVAEHAANKLVGEIKREQIRNKQGEQKYQETLDAIAKLQDALADSEARGVTYRGLLTSGEQDRTGFVRQARRLQAEIDELKGLLVQAQETVKKTLLL